MATYDFTATRLYVEGPIGAAARLTPDPDQAHYLLHVLRLADGDRLYVFDGQSGEWQARLAREGKKGVTLIAEEQVRPQTPVGDLHLLFAPLKQARFDYIVQKAVEMGASRLQPVITARTQVHRLNGERMRANAVEAAEQCGILSIPETMAPVALADAVAALDPGRLMIVCDEDAILADPLEALRTTGTSVGGLALVIGPEGGFSPVDRGHLARHERRITVSLGPRILRADTAAVAALALVQAALGDWRGSLGA